MDPEHYYRALCELQDPNSQRSQQYRASLASNSLGLHPDEVRRLQLPEFLEAEKAKCLIRSMAGGRNLIEVNHQGLAAHKIGTEGLPALHTCKAGQMRKLLNARADPNEVCPYGQVPLHRAAREGNCEKVTLLLKARANVHARTTDSRTALHKAVMADPACRSIEVVKLLLKAEADVNVSSGSANPLERKRFETPLHVASVSGFDEAAKLLIGARADLNLRTGSGHTALELARGDGDAWKYDRRDHHGASAVRQRIDDILRRVEADATDPIALAQLSEALPANESVTVAGREYTSNSSFRLALDAASARARDEDWFTQDCGEEASRRPVTPQQCDVSERLRQVAAASPDFGAKRVRELLREEGYSISQHRVRELLADFRSSSAQPRDRCNHGGKVEVVQVGEPFEQSAEPGGHGESAAAPMAEEPSSTVDAAPLETHVALAENTSQRCAIAARAVVCRIANRDYEPEVAEAIEGATKRGQCVICLEREACFVMQACSHLVYCKLCCVTAAIMARDGSKKMPPRSAKRKFPLHLLQTTQLDCAMCRTTTTATEKGAFCGQVIVCGELEA